MYYIQKTMEISAAHRLDLPYDSPCNREHGHNYIVTVFCKAPSLNEQGMVADYGMIKRLIHGILDHQNINEVFKKLDYMLEFVGGGKDDGQEIPAPTTAEVIARWIYDQIDHCYRVIVKETENNIAMYEDPEVQFEPY